MFDVHTHWVLKLFNVPKGIISFQRSSKWTRDINDSEMLLTYLTAYLVFGDQRLNLNLQGMAKAILAEPPGYRIN